MIDLKFFNSRLNLFFLSSFFALFCFFALPIYGEVTKETKNIYAEAQQNFEKGLQISGEEGKIYLLKSAQQYEQLVQDFEIQNGYLYYNLGNSYFVGGKLGKAILNYKRAERFIPTYPELKLNLQAARKQVGLELEEENSLANIQRILFFWHYLLNYQAMGILFAIFFVFFWALLIFQLFRNEIFLRWGSYFVLILTFLFGCSFSISAYELLMKKTGVITVSSIEAYKGPGLSYQNSYEQALPEGTELEVLEELGGWVKVQLANKEQTWIQKHSMESI